MEWRYIVGMYGINIGVEKLIGVGHTFGPCWGYWELWGPIFSNLPISSTLYGSTLRGWRYRVGMFVKNIYLGKLMGVGLIFYTSAGDSAAVVGLFEAWSPIFSQSVMSTLYGSPLRESK